jgi:transcriptional regulator with XRE-family HTH domain
MAGGRRTAKLGGHLKHYREAAKLKQNELGRLLGHKDGAQVSAWEAGDKVPPLELVLETAAHLGVSTSQLVGEVPPPEPGTHVTNNVVNGEHHTVYQHIETLVLASEEGGAPLRRALEAVVEVRTAPLVAELRALHAAVAELRALVVRQAVSREGPPD